MWDDADAWASLGNLVTLLGFVITAVAFGIEHRGRALGDLAPWLTRRGRWLQQRVLRIRRRKNVHGGLAGDLSALAASMRASVWAPVEPDDDLTTKVDKLVDNLDRLRSEVHQVAEQQGEETRKLVQEVSTRVDILNTKVQRERERDREVTTRAMRWQIGGFAIAVLGAATNTLAELLATN